MLKPENQIDKKRFENAKETKKEDGLGEEQAIQSAAKDVKETRKQEGRSKDSQE